MMTLKAKLQDPRRQHALRIRQKVERGIRAFFDARAFLEVRTPLLVPSPGMEVHIRPFRTTRGEYLPTSPEFAMKRLLVGGLERIYQMCSAFRDEPLSPSHHPEFLMLEWYHAQVGYEAIMQETEELFHTLAQTIHGTSSITYQGQQIDLTPPWPRLTIRGLFKELLGIELTQSPLDTMHAHCRQKGLQTAPEDTWDDLYFRLWLNFIEPALPKDRAVFVTRFPASQAALAVLDTDPDGTPWARRFEVYAGGLELGNAFEELTDAQEQRRRFEADMDTREKIYGAAFPRSPIDEGFLAALKEGMPPAGGIAMGVDRIVMLFADEPDIDRTVWLPYSS